MFETNPKKIRGRFVLCTGVAANPSASSRSDTLLRFEAPKRVAVEGAFLAARRLMVSTTLADLLRPPLVANPFSTMRASLRR
jgi:hypothetical protein